MHPFPQLMHPFPPFTITFLILPMPFQSSHGGPHRQAQALEAASEEGVEQEAWDAQVSNRSLHIPAVRRAKWEAATASAYFALGQHEDAQCMSYRALSLLGLSPQHTTKDPHGGQVDMNATVSGETSFYGLLRCCFCLAIKEEEVGKEGGCDQSPLHSLHCPEEVLPLI